MSTEHPDEGTIHAWLDGELGPAESARLASHVSGCEPCSAAVAEARGLIAGASRVVRALEPELAAGPQVAPAWGAPSATGGSVWRALRVTPARAAIAAMLLVAAGITLGRDRVARESDVAFVELHGDSSARGPVAAMSAAAPRDPLLDSAISRNIAQAMPPRTVKIAPQPGVPAAAPVASSATAVDATAGQRVAEGRAEARAARDAPPVRTDRAIPVAKSVPYPTETMAARAPGVRIPVRMDVPAPPPTVAGEVASAAASNAAPLAGQCFRVSSTTPGAAWGTLALPVVVRLMPGSDSSGGVVATTTQAGAAERELSGRWVREGADSVRVDLRRIGYTGTMRIATTGEVRGGTMRSGASQVALNEVVVTGVGAAADSAPAQAQTQMRTRMRTRRVEAKQGAAAPERAQPAAVAVTAVKVDCR